MDNHNRERGAEKSQDDFVQFTLQTKTGPAVCIGQVMGARFTEGEWKYRVKFVTRDRVEVWKHPGEHRVQAGIREFTAEKLQKMGVQRFEAGERENLGSALSRMRAEARERVNRSLRRSA